MYSEPGFPEMLAELEKLWSDDTSWDDLALICARMTARRVEIRQAKGIRPLMMNCTSCGEKHAMEMQDISLRSALCALEKCGIISKDRRETLDNEWGKYRKTISLTLVEIPKKQDHLLARVATTFDARQPNPLDLESAY